MGREENKSRDNGDQKCEGKKKERKKHRNI